MASDLFLVIGVMTLGTFAVVGFAFWISRDLFRPHPKTPIAREPAE